MAGIKDYVFPRRCPVCHDITDKPGRLICTSCKGRFSYVSEPSCMICGKEMTDGDRERCIDCENMEKSFKRNIALFNYDNVGQESMAYFKYKGRREYGEYYAREFMDKKGGLLRNFGAKVIIPVPVHKDRLYERGYNQAGEFGKWLSKELEIPLRTDLLLRTKATVAQKKVSGRDRIQNLAEAFTAPYDLSGFKKILLVDDIYTTGSTLSACSKKLLEAGAGEINCATICIGSDN